MLFRSAPDDPGTAALQQGIRALCDDGSPVVVGRLAVQPDAHQYPTVEPGLDLPTTTDPCTVASGILNTNPDTRRIPLTWYCQRLGGKPNDPQPYAGLALAAARTMDPNLEHANQRLAEFVRSATHPFTSFMTAEQWADYRLTAGEALCSHAVREYGTWQICASTPLTQKTRTQVHSRAVIIGEMSPYEDRHDAVVGNVPGYVLQANFLEAILDDRLFSPMSASVNYTAGFIFFALFEYLLEGIGERGPIRTAFALLGLIAASALVIYFMILHLGLYLNPAAVSVIFVIIRISSLIFTKARGHETPRRTSSARAPGMRHQADHAK